MAESSGVCPDSNCPSNHSSCGGWSFNHESVAATLDMAFAMAALADREGVYELIAFFGPFDEAVWLAAEERKAGDIDCRVRAARAVVIEVGQASPGVLETELIDLVVAESLRVLCNNTPIVIVLRGGARESILPESLVLPVDFDARNATRTDIATQHQAI